jgi:hypothetical protein
MTVFYGCEIWSLTLQVLGDGAPRRIFESKAKDVKRRVKETE